MRKLWLLDHRLHIVAEQSPRRKLSTTVHRLRFVAELEPGVESLDNGPAEALCTITCRE